VTDLSLAHGERIHVPERLIVAPAAGVFAPPLGGPRVEGERLRAGDAVGLVELSGEATPVCSSFSGDLIGILAEEGQMLRAGQPVAWLRVA
jgi:biotin carboxyl carrier protein